MIKFRLLGKKIIAILRSKSLLTWIYVRYFLIGDSEVALFMKVTTHGIG